MVYVIRCGFVWNLKLETRSGLYANLGVKMKAPRMTGVWNTTFQNALQSTSRIRLRHQSGPPPCSAPKTSVPALFALALSGPLTLAEPVAASASAASTTPAKSQSLRRCIYSLRSSMATRPRRHNLSSHPLLRGGPHSDRTTDASSGRLLGSSEDRAKPLGVWPRRGLTPAVASGREGVRAGDDFQDLLGDLRLPGAVHGQRQVVDQLAGVLARVPHRGHLGAVLRGGGLEEGTVELRLDVDRKEPLQDLLRFRLEDEVTTESVFLALVLVGLEQRFGER